MANLQGIKYSLIRYFSIYYPYFQCFSVNPFHVTDLLMPPENMFSGGIKIDQWHEMG